MASPQTTPSAAVNGGAQFSSWYASREEPSSSRIQQCAQCPSWTWTLKCFSAPSVATTHGGMGLVAQNSRRASRWNWSSSSDGSSLSESPKARSNLINDSAGGSVTSPFEAR